MPTIVLIPILVIILIVGAILLAVRSFNKMKGLRRVLLWGGGLIIGAPLALILLFYLADTQTHKKYTGEYYGVTDQGHRVTLNLNSNKEFTLRIDECEEQVVGSWDCELHDQYVLELHINENEYGIQAWLSDSEIAFLNPLNESCMDMERLKMKKVANNA